MNFRSGFRVAMKSISPPVDSFVSWTSPAGQTVRGKVCQSFTSGTIKANAKSPGFMATQAAPVIEVEIYEEKTGGWQPTGDKLIRPARACVMVADLRRPITFTGCKTNIKQDDDTPDEIIIYGDIGDGGWFDDGSSVTAKDIRDALAKVKEGKDIDLRINSTGGDAFEGMAIYNLLAQHQKKTGCTITGYNDGICASAATVIACAAKKFVAGQQSMYMIHRGWSIAIGDINDFQKSIELLTRIDDQTIDLYTSFVNARKVKTKRDEMATMVDNETWMTAEETVSNGFADEIYETRGQVAASYGAKRPWMSCLPDALKGKFSAVDGKLKSRVPGLTERAEAAETAA